MCICASNSKRFQPEKGVGADCENRWIVCIAALTASQTQLVDLILGGKVPLLALARMCGGWLRRAQCYLGSDRSYHRFTVASLVNS